MNAIPDVVVHTVGHGSGESEVSGNLLVSAPAVDDGFFSVEEVHNF